MIIELTIKTTSPYVKLINNLFPNVIGMIICFHCEIILYTKVLCLQETIVEQ